MTDMKPTREDFTKQVKFGVIKQNRFISNKSNFNDGRWSKEEHNIFVYEILRHGIQNWKKVNYKI